MVEKAQPEAVAFEHHEPATLIYLTCPEGTNLCPRSGFPDFWTLHLWYVPSSWIVELKSWKLYLNSFRNHGIFHEELPHRLLQKFREKIQPRYVKMVCDFTRRGNIQTDVSVEYREEAYQGPEAPQWKVRYDLR